VLIIVQNLPVPFDRRVWLECQTLVRAGYDVSVVCPRGEGTGPEQVIDGVRILAYPPYAPGGGALGFMFEYAYSFLATAWLALKARRQGSFRVVQACNPPDIFWPLAWALRQLDGSRFVFDHHDLCPELFQSRFPDGPAVFQQGLLFLERATFRTADRVTSTNESYAAIATTRGGKAPRARHGRAHRARPRAAATREPVPRLRRGRTPPRGLPRGHGAPGRRGPRDARGRRRRPTWGVTTSRSPSWVGRLLRTTSSAGATSSASATSSTCPAACRTIRRGRCSTADVGLPRPAQPAQRRVDDEQDDGVHGVRLPVVAFDLRETKVSASRGGPLRRPDDVEDTPQAVVALLDDPTRRTEMGRQGRERVVRHLAWEHQQDGYLRVFDELVGSTSRVTVADEGA
jgi:glycosyltransferase involved in cell wall biosynthesis